MRDFTRTLRNEMDKDFEKITYRNNSKFYKMSEEEQQQSINNKKAHYTNKWTGYLRECETPSQKAICNRMITLIANNTR